MKFSEQPCTKGERTPKYNLFRHHKSYYNTGICGGSMESDVICKWFTHRHHSQM